MVHFGILPCLISICVVWTAASAENEMNGFNNFMNGQGFHLPFNRQLKFNKDLIGHWASKLSTNLTLLTMKLTAYEEVYSKFNSYYRNRTLDVKALLKKTAKNINNLLQDRVRAVKDLVRKAEEASTNHTFRKGLLIDYLNNKKLLSDDDFRMMKINVSDASVTESNRYMATTPNPHFNNLRVNLNVSTVHVPTNVYDKAPLIMNGVAWSEHLNKQFIQNNKTHTGLAWQYFCSSDGFFRVYPGMKWPRNNRAGNIDMFDCRVRPWYIQASASPKNVIILVDTSGSMKGLRMEIALSTIKHILNTFSEDDYFNILQFSNKVVYTDPCFERTLMQANKENRERLNNYVKNMQTKNIAKFDVALQEAFDLFDREEKKLRDPKPHIKCRERSSSHLCNKIIMILTDGAPEGYEKIFKERNWDFNTNRKKVRVFTFLIGREVSDNRNAKWMACANKGYYTHVSTLPDVQENVQHYLKVLSRPLVINNAQNQVWTKVYADYNTEVSSGLASGLKFVTSFGMPVYDKKDQSLTGLKKGKLLGVMGTDIPIEQIKGYLPTSKLGANGYAFMVRDHDYVVFHPNFHPFYLKRKREKMRKEEKRSVLQRSNKDHSMDNDGSKDLTLKANYSNMEIEHVEYVHTKDTMKKLRKFVRACNPSSSLTLRELVIPYAKKKRVAVRSMTYYIHPIGNTTFKLVFAVPTKYGKIDYWLGGAEINSNQLRLFLDVNTKFAPWRYCNSDETLLLNEQERRLKLYQLFFPQDDKGKECEEDFELDLFALYVKQLSGPQEVVESWRHAASEFKLGTFFSQFPFPYKEFYESIGVELIFLWTRSGITRYLNETDKLTDPNFIDRNLRTVENPYFKRAVEGKLESGYNYTFSIPIGDGPFDPNHTVVTITLPVTIHETIIPVVMGIQVKYTKFQEMIERIVFDCDGVRPCDFTCENASMSCYLLDNHGYIMASITNRSDENMGNFFGDVDPILMQELVDKNIYKQEHFVDYQAMCETIDGDDRDSSATNLLDPFRILYNGFLWFVTELVIFLSEWSFSSWWESYGVTGVAPCQMIGPADNNYNEEEMDPTERKFYNELKFCPSKSVLIPCHKNITLYRANISRFKIKNRPIDGAIPNCLPRCNKTWVVSWISNTNLIFLATSAYCMCEDPNDPEAYYNTESSTVNTDGKKIEYTQELFCNRLQKRSRYNRRLERPNTCVDSAPDEDDSACGQAGLTVSFILILLCSLTSYTLNRTPESYL